MDIEYKFDYRFNPKSNRLENYDYSENGGYFITICTKDRQEYFGEIVECKMILNDIGKKIEKYYLEIPKHFENVIIDEFVVMPNHIHFVIFVNKKDLGNKIDVAVLHLYNNQKNNKKNNFGDRYFSKISPKKGELGTIIRSFKSICTKEINKMQDKIYFAWQNNYYDRIIRNEDELNRIRKYIFENPLKWELENNNEQGIFI